MSLLRVESLSKRFGNVVTAHDVSFEVSAGEVLGVVGPNGAGKSTLLDLIAGTVKPDGGRIGLAGQDISGWDAPARARRGIGLTHQVPRPFAGLTVFENVLVGARFAGGLRGRAAQQAACEALALTGLMSQANSPAGKLRLLERKRLELARALATAPRLVLLDEIAGGLSEQELPELVGLIAGLREQGLGVVWIEHIVHALLRVCDRMLCLALGEVVAVGEPHAVLGDPRVIEVYLGSTLDLGVTE